MKPGLRDTVGFSFAMGAMGVLGYAIVMLKEHDYIGATLLVMTGLSLLRAGMELLRPSLGG